MTIRCSFVLEGSSMTKSCTFMFGRQQYDETVQFCVWKAAVLRNGAVLCLEFSSITKRCTLVFGGQRYDETLRFCVWKAAL
jgi:hypothetical protein